MEELAGRFLSVLRPPPGFTLLHTLSRVHPDTHQRTLRSYFLGTEMDPDLTSVLNTLSALSGVPAAAAGTPTVAAAEQSTATATATATPVPSTPNTPAGSTNTAPGKGPDPSKISTWPPALRYITSRAQHPPFQSRVKQLVSSQRAHERKWWEGREAVVQRVREREGRRGEVEGVLYVVPALLRTGLRPTNPVILDRWLIGRRAVGAPVIEYKVFIWSCRHGPEGS